MFYFIFFILTTTSSIKNFFKLESKIHCFLLFSALKLIMISRNWSELKMGATWECPKHVCPQHDLDNFFFYKTSQNPNNSKFEDQICTEYSLQNLPNEQQFLGENLDFLTRAWHGQNFPGHPKDGQDLKKSLGISSWNLRLNDLASFD